MQATARVICRCPACHSSLAWSDDSVKCEGCGSLYPVRNQIPVLVASASASRAPEPERPWYRGAQGLLPRLRRLAEPHEKFFWPTLTYKPRRARDEVRQFIASCPPQALIVNVGSGATDYGANVINMDIDVFPNVDVVGVAERLPFADGCCEGAILMAVLEHVEDADRSLSEVRRILAPGGRLHVDVPFLQGYHPGPVDYRRYTEQGLRAELERYGFVIEASGVAVGPASAMAWVTAEFLAMLFSGRSRKVYRFTRHFASWLALPIKYADHWLDRHPMAHKIPSAVWATARIPSEASQGR
jgi:uncharacterized protein YbaR (Trm112 family)